MQIIVVLFLIYTAVVMAIVTRAFVRLSKVEDESKKNTFTHQSEPFRASQGEWSRKGAIIMPLSDADTIREEMKEKAKLEGRDLPLEDLYPDDEK